VAVAVMLLPELMVQRMPTLLLFAQLAGGFENMEERPYNE
jgi:hypothetical protein